jgi:malonyl CoA-acyl carrier protein transacylase/NADP-dependent 3-hydroxy acid dehydrogenase YdfG
VADDAAHAAAALAGLTRAEPGQSAERPPRVAFLFSGQGSQYAGMGTGLYRAVPAYRAAVDECAGLLRDHIGADLRDLVLAMGEDRAAADTRLSRTALTQPALFTVEYALARTWSAWGVEPAAMIGHSVGEYVAATLAGVFTLAGALRLVARRGALMESLTAGSMLAVRLSEPEARASLPAELSNAAVNTADSCVVAGPARAVDAFAATLGERGVATTRLRTSHAFHSAMMEPILVAFRDEVAATTRRAPDRPLVSSLTGGWVTTELTEPSYWTRQLRETVRFADGLTTLLADGDWALVEVGPGGQLAGPARRHMGGRRLAPLISMPGPDEPGSDHATLLAAAGRLWVAGVDVDVDLGAPAGRRVPLPTYPFERKRFWVEPTATEDEAEPEPTAGPRPVEEWFAVPAWRQVAAPTPAGQMEGQLLVIGAGAPALELAGRLRAAGFDVRVADPAAPESFFAGGTVPPRIVYAAAWPGRPASPGPGPSHGPDPGAAWTAQETGFFGVLTLSQALAVAQPEGPVHLDILTAGTHGVIGDDLCSPEHATLDGPALTIPLELPWLTVRHVDGPAGPGTVDDVVAELIRPTPDGGPIVALRGGRRWVRDWEPLPLPARPGAAGIRQGDVCLVTGGLGGIGITVAEDLACRDGARIALLSRTPLPYEPEWDRYLAVHGTADRLGRAIAAVRRMRAAGAEVIVLTGDVTSVTDLGRVRAEIFGRFGRLDIIVHAAGVPGGGMAEVKERAQAEAVLAPKVRGTFALAAAFGDLPLRAVVLCASLTGVAGGFGQVDYCGANAFLDAVAQAGTAFSGPIVSIDWEAGWTSAWPPKSPRRAHSGPSSAGW